VGSEPAIVRGAGLDVVSCFDSRVLGAESPIGELGQKMTVAKFCVWARRAFIAGAVLAGSACQSPVASKPVVVPQTSTTVAATGARTATTTATTLVSTTGPAALATATPTPAPTAASTAAAPPAPASAPFGAVGTVVALPSTTTTIEALQPTTTTPKAMATTSTKAAATVYYANCAAARAAGVAPLHRGDPGYRSGLDRDGDGIACE